MPLNGNALSLAFVVFYLLFLINRFQSALPGEQIAFSLARRRAASASLWFARENLRVQIKKIYRDHQLGSRAHPGVWGKSLSSPGHGHRPGARIADRKAMERVRILKKQ